MDIVYLQNHDDNQKIITAMKKFGCTEIIVGESMNYKDATLKRADHNSHLHCGSITLKMKYVKNLKNKLNDDSKENIISYSFVCFGMCPTEYEFEKKRANYRFSNATCFRC